MKGGTVGNMPDTLEGLRTQGEINRILGEEDAVLERWLRRRRGFPERAPEKIRERAYAARGATEERRMPKGRIEAVPEAAYTARTLEGRRA